MELKRNSRRKFKYGPKHFCLILTRECVFIDKRKKKKENKRKKERKSQGKREK